MILPAHMALTILLAIASAGLDHDSLRSAADSLPVSGASVFDSLPAIPKPEPDCSFSLERLTVSDGRLCDTLDLMMERSNLDPAAFDLKFAVESPLVRVVEVLPGEVIDSCRWSLFRPRRVAADSVGLGPSEVWQIVAIAQQVSDSRGPLCYGFQRPASIARLVVSSAHAAAVPDTTVGIFFYWESCRDNAVSDRQGSSTLFSKSVTDGIPIAWKSSHAAFPTRMGTPDECISDRAAVPPRRALSFVNGGVTFKAAPVSDSAR